MDIQVLAALGEAVGGLAVLFTLAYLAFQVRQSNRIATAQAQQNILLTMNAWHREALTREVAEIRAKLRSGSLNELDGTDAERAEAHVYGIYNIWVAVQSAYDQGVISQDILDSYARDVGLEIERYPAMKPRLMSVWRKYPVGAEWPVFAALRQQPDGQDVGASAMR